MGCAPKGTGRFAATLGATVIAVGFSGCGGDDGSDALSREEFIEQADAACDRFNQSAPAQNAATAEEAARQAEEDAAARERNLAELTELEPPQELEEDVSEYALKTREMIQNLREVSAAAERDDGEAFRAALQTFDRIGSERQQVADRIGFEICGQPRDVG